MKLTLLLLLFIPSRLRAQTDANSEPKSAESTLQSLEERISKLEGAPAKASLSSFNPAMGMALDFAYLHSNDKAGFQFRAAELNVEAPIDPFLKGWAVITGSNGTPAVDVEEAALETTSLPYNLIVRGGRLFASFGRLAHFHDHELPVINRPLSLDSFIGGETRADGIETSFLAPTNQYINLTFGMYDKIGTNNARQDPTGSRPLDEFTYLGRANTYQDIGENHSVELGVDSAWTPKRTVADTSGPGGTSLGINTRKNTWRTLNGLDFTYRYQPARGGLYHGIVWGAEVLQNNERRFNPTTSLPTDRVRAYSGFSYVQAKMGPHWRPGVMVDITENLDKAHQVTKTYTAYLTYDVTEFQRLRTTFSEAVVNTPGAVKNHTIGLQWTGVLGHHVHGFRDR